MLLALKSIFVPANLIPESNPLMGDLHVGSILSTGDTFIREKNIQVVISMIHIPDPPGTIHYTYYIPDNRSSQSQFDRMIPEITALIQAHRKAGLNVLVHCRAGIHRGPAVIAHYLKRYRGLSTENAIEVIKQARPIAFIDGSTFRL